MSIQLIINDWVSNIQHLITGLNAQLKNLSYVQQDNEHGPKKETNSLDTLPDEIYFNMPYQDSLKIHDRTEKDYDINDLLTLRAVRQQRRGILSFLDKDDVANLAFVNRRLHQICRQTIQFIDYPRVNYLRPLTHAVSKDHHVCRENIGNILAMEELWDGQFVMGSQNKHIYRINLNTHKLEKDFVRHHHWVTNLRLLPNGRLISGSVDGLLMISELTNDNYNILGSHQGRINAIDVSPNGDLIVSASKDKTVKLWDLNRFQCLATLNGHKDFVDAVAFLADNTIISTSFDRTTCLWEPLNGQWACSIKKSTDDPIKRLCVLDRQHVITGSSNGRLQIWNPGDDTVTELANVGTAVTAIVHLKGQMFLSGHENGMLYFWHTQKNDHQKCLQFDGPIYDVAHTASGELIVSHKHGINTCQFDKLISSSSFFNKFYDKFYSKNPSSGPNT